MEDIDHYNPPPEKKDWLAVIAERLWWTNFMLAWIALMMGGNG